MTDESTAKKVLQLAMNMAACAAERATSQKWREHPMFGINVDADRWAQAYQSNRRQIEVELGIKPNVQVHPPRIEALNL